MTLFSNEFQGGVSFEVFTPQGSNPLANWKITGPGSKGTKKVYEKEVKGYVFSCPGGHGFKMQFPKDERKSMCLLQPFLCFQMHITDGQQFALELSVTTEDKTRRRLFLSTAFQELKATALHAQVPLRSLRREGWTNLVFNTAALVENCFPHHAIRSIDLFILSGCFKIRRVFTLKQQPPDTISSHAMAEVMAYETVPVPVALDFPVGVERETQVLDGMTLFGKMQPLPMEKKAGTPVLSAVRQHPEGPEGVGALLDLGIQGEAKKVSRERARGTASPPQRRRSARKVLDSGGAGGPEHRGSPGTPASRLLHSGMSQRSTSSHRVAAAADKVAQHRHHLDDGRRVHSAAVQRQVQNPKGGNASQGEPAAFGAIERIEETAASVVARKPLSAIGGGSGSPSGVARGRLTSSRMSAAPPRVNIDPFDLSSSSLALPHSSPQLSPNKHQRQLGGAANSPALPRSPSQHRLNSLKGMGDRPHVTGLSTTDPALSKWGTDGMTVSSSTSLAKFAQNARYGDTVDTAELQQASSSKRFWGETPHVQPEDIPLHRQLDPENVLLSRSGRERVPPLSQQSQQHSQQMLLASGASSQLPSSSSRDLLSGRVQHIGAPAASGSGLQKLSPPAVDTLEVSGVSPPAATGMPAQSASALSPMAAGSARSLRRTMIYASTDDHAHPAGAQAVAASGPSAPPLELGGPTVMPNAAASVSGMPPIISPSPLPDAMQSTSPRASMGRASRANSFSGLGHQPSDVFAGSSLSRNRVELQSIERARQQQQPASELAAHALTQHQPLGSNHLDEAGRKLASEVLDEVLRSSGSSVADEVEEDEAVSASTAFAGPPEEEGPEEQRSEAAGASLDGSRLQEDQHDQPQSLAAQSNAASEPLLQTAPTVVQQHGLAGPLSLATEPERDEESESFLSRKVIQDLAGIEAEIAAARKEAGETSSDDLWQSRPSLDATPRQRKMNSRKSRNDNWPEMSDDTYSMINMMNTQRAFTPPVVPASKVTDSNRTVKLESDQQNSSAGSDPSSEQDSSIDYRDLIYDPILNCYYDSKSNQYFSLT